MVNSVHDGLGLQWAQIRAESRDVFCHHLNAMHPRCVDAQQKLGQSAAAINTIENLSGRVAAHMRKVKRWHDGQGGAVLDCRLVQRREPRLPCDQSLLHHKAPRRRARGAARLIPSSRPRKCSIRGVTSSGRLDSAKDITLMSSTMLGRFKSITSCDISSFSFLPQWIPV